MSLYSYRHTAVSGETPTPDPLVSLLTKVFESSCVRSLRYGQWGFPGYSAGKFYDFGVVSAPDLLAQITDSPAIDKLDEAFKKHDLAYLQKGWAYGFTGSATEIKQRRNIDHTLINDLSRIDDLKSFSRPWITRLVASLMFQGAGLIYAYLLLNNQKRN